MEEAQGCGWLVRVREEWEVDEGHWEWEGGYILVPCGAEVTEHPNGWECARGHSHFAGVEYFDDDEVAGMQQAGFPFPANAARVDGSPIG